MNLENFGNFSLTAIVLFCAGWLVKKWLESKIKKDVEQKYEKELAKFKIDLESSKEKEIAKLNSELNQKTQIAIANLNSQLNIIEAQNNIRFSSVFEKTADVIAHVYSDLVHLENLCKSHTEFSGPDEQQRQIQRQEFKNKLNDFWQYFGCHQPYLPKATAATTTEIYKQLAVVSAQYDSYLHARHSHPNPFARPENSAAALMDMFFKSRSKLEILLEQLHDDFQKHLGVAMEIKETSQPPSPESSINPADYYPKAK